MRNSQTRVKDNRMRSITRQGILFHCHRRIINKTPILCSCGKGPREHKVRLLTKFLAWAREQTLQAIKGGQALKVRSGTNNPIGTTGTIQPARTLPPPPAFVALFFRLPLGFLPPVSFAYFACLVFFFWSIGLCALLAQLWLHFLLAGSATGSQSHSWRWRG